MIRRPQGRQAIALALIGLVGSLATVVATPTPAGAAVFGAVGSRVSGGGSDGFVARYGLAGAASWVHGFGGPGEEIGVAVDATYRVAGEYDAAFDVVVSGRTETTWVPQGVDVVVLQAAVGECSRWMTLEDSPGDDHVGGLVAGAGGWSYLVANAENPSGHLVLGELEGVDGYVVGLPPNLAVGWGRRIGGTGTDTLSGVAVAPNGDVVVGAAIGADATVGYGNGSMDLDAPVDPTPAYATFRPFP